MASLITSSKPLGCYETRSISLQSRSHPTTLLIQEELNKLKSWEALSSCSSSSICIGLSGLGELYRRMEDFLSLPLTQQALAHHQDEKWIHELLDGSMTMLDICGSTRDSIVSIKENVRELQSSLRRRKAGESDTIEADVNAYMSFRKRIKKEMEKSLALLKLADKKTTAWTSSDVDRHLSAVVRVVREASSVTGTVFVSMLSFLSAPVSAKKRLSGRWRVVSKLLHKGAVAACDDCRRESLSEMEAVDAALSDLLTAKKMMSEAGAASKKLEDLDAAAQELEDGLEWLFRRLINTRVSFLNILSQ